MRETDRDDRLSELIERLYDAALDERLWSGISSQIAHAFDSSSTALKMYAGTATAPCPSSLQRSAKSVHLLEVTENLVIAPKDREWSEYWHSHDRWVELADRVGLGRVGTSHELIPDPEFERSAFYQDWNRRLGVFYMVGAAFRCHDGAMCVLGIHRPKQMGPYLREDAERLGRFLPHLERALGLRDRLREADLMKYASLDALDRIDMGVAIVDAACRVLQLNQVARTILDGSTQIRIRGGRLAIDDPGCAARLTRAVRAALLASPSGVAPVAQPFLVPRDARLPMTVLATPLRPGWDRSGGAPPLALVFFRDPELGSADQNALRDMFGFTRAEAAIAARLADGLRIERVAAELGVEPSTVRSHLKTVFSKTGTHRQSQLVALIARSVASVRGPVPSES